MTRFARGSAKTAAGKPTPARLSKCDAVSVAALLSSDGYPTGIAGRDDSSGPWEFWANEEFGVVFLFALRVVPAVFDEDLPDYPNVTANAVSALEEKFNRVKPLFTPAGLSAEQHEDEDGAPYWLVRLASSPVAEE